MLRRAAILPTTSRRCLQQQLNQQTPVSILAPLILSSSTTNTHSRRPFTTSTPLHKPPRIPRLPLSPGLPRRTPYQPPVTFNQLLRKFKQLVHPDKFSQEREPVQQKANQEALAELNAFVGQMKTKNDRLGNYPPAQEIRLVFYVKKHENDAVFFPWNAHQGNQLMTRDFADSMFNPANRPKLKRGEVIVAKYKQFLAKSIQENDLLNLEANNAAANQPTEPEVITRGAELSGEYHLLPLLLTPNGRYCAKLIAKQFRSVFKRAGVESAAFGFEWDQEYWRMGPNEWAEADKFEKKQADWAAEAAKNPE